MSIPIERRVSVLVYDNLDVGHTVSAPINFCNCSTGNQQTCLPVFHHKGYVRFEDQGFPSIRELLDYHVQNKVHVTKKSKAILVNPVERAGKDKWEMRREDIVLQEKRLGSGHFGDVMKGVLKPNNIPIAVKSCKANVTQVVKRKFLAEAEILKQYDHPNIVKLIGGCADREPVFIGNK